LLLYPVWLWGPLSLLSNGYVGGRALSTGVKWLECEADHSPPARAEVKNVWSYTSLLRMSRCGAYLGIGYTFVAWYIVKHRDNFTFILSD
jgi:hypothetical protein